jgi:hypothetical protein
MIPEFSNSLPKHLHTAVLISGNTTAQFQNNIYILLKVGGEYKKAFEIRYEYHCSPFKETVVYNNQLAVGYEGFFYLFDITANKLLLCLEMSGYFGHLYLDKHAFFVTDAYGMYCICVDGQIRWRNRSLGIDGVTIEKIEDSKIYGSGEWDPPGGWKDFVIETKTGKLLS